MKIQPAVQNKSTYSEPAPPLSDTADISFSILNAVYQGKKPYKGSVLEGFFGSGETGQAAFKQWYKEIVKEFGHPPPDQAKFGFEKPPVKGYRAGCTRIDISLPQTDSNSPIPQEVVASFKTSKSDREVLTIVDQWRAQEVKAYQAAVASQNWGKANELRSKIFTGLAQFYLTAQFTKRPALAESLYTHLQNADSPLFRSLHLIGALLININIEDSQISGKGRIILLFDTWNNVAVTQKALESNSSVSQSQQSQLQILGKNFLEITDPTTGNQFCYEQDEENNLLIPMQDVEKFVYNDEETGFSILLKEGYFESSQESLSNERLEALRQSYEKMYLKDFAYGGKVRVSILPPKEDPQDAPAKYGDEVPELNDYDLESIGY